MYIYKVVVCCFVIRNYVLCVLVIMFDVLVYVYMFENKLMLDFWGYWW